VAGLYLHVPFRDEPRVYDEAPYDSVSANDRERFVAAVRNELRQCISSHLKDASVSTVYIGGGRPSLLSLNDLSAIRSTLDDIADLREVHEVSMEVAPSDATASYLRGLRQMGVTRLSLSTVDLVAEGLQTMEAPHTVDKAVETVDMARHVGFESFSVDLTFGNTAFSENGWTTSLQRVVELEVPHVTLIEVPSHEAEEDEQCAGRLEQAMSVLTSAGYEQYGVPHFSQPGHRSRHQQNYYTHGNYLGAGPGAESFWWPKRGPNTPARRWSNVTDLDAYVSRLKQGKAAVQSTRGLDAIERAQEYLLLRLQTQAGLDLSVLRSRYGVALGPKKADLLGRLVGDGLIYDDPDRIKCTPKGRLHTDAITRDLLKGW